MNVDAVLGALHVEHAEFRVEHRPPGPLTLPTGRHWTLVALARGRIALSDTTLDAGDAVLTRGRDALVGEVVDGAIDGDADRDVTVLVAGFDLPGAAGRLVRLPDDVVERADSPMCRLLVERLVDQVGTAGAGDVVSARLLDWLVTSTVRDALVRTGSGAVSDPVVAAGLGAVHDDPAAGWTVEGLARHAGVSRAAFAQRFRDAVGVSPLAYVREHRLDLAEQALLTEPGVTVAAVARRVGYASPFSLSTAFRRHRGLAPSEVRPAQPRATVAGPGTIRARSAPRRSTSIDTSSPGTSQG